MLLHTQPGGPGGPGGPVGPGAPFAPMGPFGPGGPYGPVFPITPSTPLTPFGPLLPCSPSMPSFPLYPLGPVGPRAPVLPRCPLSPNPIGCFSDCCFVYDWYCRKIVDFLCTEMGIFHLVTITVSMMSFIPFYAIFSSFTRWSPAPYCLSFWSF